MKASVAHGDNRSVQRNFIGKLQLVADRNFTAVQNSGEDAFTRHNAIAHLLINRAVIVAFLADLRYLEKNFAAF